MKLEEMWLLANQCNFNKRGYRMVHGITDYTMHPRDSTAISFIPGIMVPLDDMIAMLAKMNKTKLYPGTTECWVGNPGFEGRKLTKKLFLAMLYNRKMPAADDHEEI